MGKTILAAVIASTCLWSSLTEAQTAPSPGATGVTHGTPGAPRGGSFGVTIRQDAPPPPSRPAGPPASPLPRDLVPPAPPSALDRVDLFRAGPRTYTPRGSGQRFYGGYGSGSGYITDPFGYISQSDSSPRLTEYMREGRGEGYLRIDLEPDTARVYVDGLYVGTVADFGRGRALDAGPHRVEIRADGFEPLTVDVRIRANDTMSYRGTLSKIEQRTELRPAAAPKTFYVIPRCYAGDVRPQADQLPPGCQLARLREVPPVKAPAAR